MAYKKSYQKKPEVQQIGFTPTFAPSPEQSAIFDLWDNTNKNVYCDAKAGSGKSTTLVWMMSRLRKPGGMLAFATDIVNDIKPRCAPWITVKTAHAFGYASLYSHYKTRLIVDSDGVKVANILKRQPCLDPNRAMQLGMDIQTILSQVREVKRLIGLMKLTMTHEEDTIGIMLLIKKFGIEIDDIDSIIQCLPDVFNEILKTPTYIDFEDMMWIPLRLGLPIPKFDVLYCDEVQDFNNLMIEYVNAMAGGKIVKVGDRRQAIYGFAGSNTKSVDSLVSKFSSETLPLNVCYRCDKNIISLAQTIVPEIAAFEGNGMGVVNDDVKAIDHTMPDGSMILCRRNAPLIKPAFKLLKEGRKAIIKGRDIGSGIKDLIDKTGKNAVNEILDAVENITAERIAKLASRKSFNPSQMDMITDQRDAVFALSEDCDNASQIKVKIDLIFKQEGRGIILSSIHRSKGLEADNVTIIDYGNVRLNHDKMSEEDHTQEANLQYVGITRAKHRLDLVR